MLTSTTARRHRQGSAKLSIVGTGTFVDSELTADDMRAAQVAAEQGASIPANAGCIDADSPSSLMCEAYHLGELKGEASGYHCGYVNGWRWGAVCGTVFGSMLVACGLLLSRWVVA